jgi:hypothetical protein
VSIYEAAEELQAKLRGYDWLLSVAVGGLDDKEVIFVFTKRTVKSKELEGLTASGWRGFEVKIEKVGRAMPANI